MLDRQREQIGLPPMRSILRYAKETPSPKQQLFLDQTCEELLFGGAAGGGKTSALLMSALQYVHVPTYSCLILRRDFPRLALPGAIMDRSKAWLLNSDASWNSSKKLWTFPSGATIQFGFIDNPDDRHRYTSTEYQRIIWDEFTEMLLLSDDSNLYEFMFSRMRKLDDVDIPITMRLGTNPGQIGHQYTKKRFITQAAIEAIRNDTIPPDAVYFATPDRGFIPSFAKDNPRLDVEDYMAKLSHLPVVTRGRLMRGDWEIREDSLIDASLPRRYRIDGNGIVRIYDGSGEHLLAEYHEHDAHRFGTADPAGTAADKAKKSRGRDHSWSVIQTWDQPPADAGKWLVLRHNWREQVNFNGLCAGLRDQHEAWNHAKLRIENEKLGEAAVNILGDKLPIDTVPTGGKDKITRAAELFQMLERGEIVLPFDAPWLDALESEWFSWTGHPDEMSDQIDPAAYAAIEASGSGRGTWPPELFGPHIWCEHWPAASMIEATSCMVYPVPQDQIGLGFLGGVVTCSVRGDGIVYVTCRTDGQSGHELKRQISPMVQQAGRWPDIVMLHHASSTLQHDVHFEIVRENCDVWIEKTVDVDQHLEILGEWINNRKLRFERNEHTLRLINRLKTYPHSRDVILIHALAAALSGLGRCL